MPWLIKDQEKRSDNLFFIHVPRCGGTSLMKYHDVPNKAMEGRSLWGQWGMRIYFHRYRLFESVNFPIYTKSNAVFALMIVGAVALQIMFYDSILARGLTTFVIVSAIALSIGLTFIFTAPTIGRFTMIRRAYLILIHYVLCRWMESIEWCTGTNKHGYINHLTAHKLMNHGYVSEEEMEACSSMAIVRNPYSRMVSIYMYNRFGPLESFPQFIRSWYRTTREYRTTGEMEDWYTPCHAIPQFEYTHYDGKQVVQSIVKQEELKFLKSKQNEHLAVKQDCTVSDLPEPVRRSLLGMPHNNRRKTDKKWWEYYDQETLDLTYEMYRHDFDVFHYSPELTQRPDLKSPVPKLIAQDVIKMLRYSDRDLLSREIRLGAIRESILKCSARTSMLSERMSSRDIEEVLEGVEE